VCEVNQKHNNNEKVYYYCIQNWMIEYLPDVSQRLHCQKRWQEIHVGLQRIAQQDLGEVMD